MENWRTSLPRLLQTWGHQYSKSFRNASTASTADAISETSPKETVPDHSHKTNEGQGHSESRRRKASVLNVPGIILTSD